MRIPASVLAAARLDLDQPVDVREEDGRVIIEPVRRVHYDLEELVAGITPENRHDEVETGPAYGREIW